MFVKAILLLPLFVALSRAYSINGLCTALGDGGLIPNRGDCSKFYECAAGRVVELSCSDGLLFNSKTNLCDYPKNTDCILSDPIIDDSIPNGLCSAYSNGDLIPNELDCHKFYECTNAGPVTLSCPTGLVYNRAKKVCDYSENTICTRALLVAE